MDANRWPLMLYRLGDGIEFEGKKLATLIVADAEAEASAIAEGWSDLVTALKDKAEAAVKKVKGK